MRGFIRKSVSDMDGYVPGEQPKDADFIKLNTNENPYSPSPQVQLVLREFSAGELRRYPDPVCAELRDAIAYIHNCRMEQVFVGNGSDEILSLCTRAFVESGQTVSYFEPSYSLYPVLAAIRDVDTEPVELGDDFQWRFPDPASAGVFFLTNPNAPTGLLYPRDQVAEFCRSFQGVVVLDEAYVHFASCDCMELALQFENVVCMRTFSKSFSLAGIRVGYAVGSPALMEALFKIKDSYNVNVLSQSLALAAIRDIDYMRRNVERIKKSRLYMCDELNSMGFAVFPSETNFLWVRHNSFEAAVLFEKLKQSRILVRHFAGRRTGEYLRITVGAEDEVEQLVRTLRKICR